MLSMKVNVCVLFAGYLMAGIVLDGEMGAEEGSDLPVLKLLKVLH